MKKISLLFAFVLLLASCSENNLVTPDPGLGEGASTSLGLVVAPMQGDVNSRSVDLTTVDENRINDLWVFQFEKTADGSGALLKKSHLLVTDATKVDIVLAQNELNKTSNIHFVANVGSNELANFYGNEAAFKTVAGRVSTELGFITSNGELNPAATKCIPMSGYLLDKAVTQLGIGEQIQVILTRMLVRIDFTCNVGDLAAQKFILQKIRLCNVPNTMKYFDENVNPADEHPAAPADGSTLDFDIEVATANSGKVYSFYIPENLRGIGENVTTYDKYKTGKQGATYFEISGNGEGELYGEKIMYTLYPGKDMINNYDLKRNTKYNLVATLGNVNLSDLRVKKIPVSSNCYIVKPNASVEIPISRANESALGTQIPNVLAPNCTAYVYWETGASTGGVVTIDPATTACPNGLFKVNAVGVGNAVVAIKNATGDILWSWHIWVSDADFTNTIVANGNTWMDRSLGATDVAAAGTTYATTAGMMYQWGRKDPFLPPIVDQASITSTSGTKPIASSTNINQSYVKVGASTKVNSGDNYLMRATLATTGSFTYANQLSYSVKAPMLYLVNWAGSTATVAAAVTTAGGMDSWSGEYGQPKSVYDPCPAGWRVPSGRAASSTFASPWGTSTVITKTTQTNGTFFTFPGFGTYSRSGYRNYTTGALTNVGVFSDYWSASVASTDLAYVFQLQSDNVQQGEDFERSYGFHVRCVKG